MKLSGNYTVNDLIQIVQENAGDYFAELGDSLQSPEKVVNFLKTAMFRPEKEQFAVLFLDNRHHVKSFKIMFEGTVDCSVVYPREVIKQALLENAAAIFLSHNHPGGSIIPSHEDIKVTAEIKEGCEFMGIRLLDHIIVGNGYYSFKESGEL